MEAFWEKEEQENNLNDLMDIIMQNMIEEEEEEQQQQQQQQKEENAYEWIIHQQQQQQENTYEGIIYQETQHVYDHSDMFTKENMTQICYDLCMYYGISLSSENAQGGKQEQWCEELIHQEWKIH